MRFKEKYKTIAQIIKNKIHENQYKDYLPPLKDILSEYNIAQRTATRAFDILKRDGIIIYEKGIGHKIISAPAVLHERKNLRICLIKPFLHDLYNMPRSHKYISGVLACCRKFGSQVEIYNNKKNSSTIIAELKKRKDIQAIIFIPGYPGTYNTEDINNELKKFRIPVVTNYFELHKNLSQVDYGDYDVIRAVFTCCDINLPSYFFSLNYISEWVRNREMHFKSIFKKSGKIFKIPDTALMDWEPEKFFRIGYRTAGFYFDKLKFPANIIGVNDYIACGALKFLVEKQISFPGENRLIGIDNDSISSKYMLTTADLNFYKKGYYTALHIHKHYRELAEGKKVDC
ncbi:MAG TPA: hypothetical protein DC049_15200, partial [Spirochaetia bacterium]|nr:hypothetical protein [Spirochaetia bacterium]